MSEFIRFLDICIPAFVPALFIVMLWDWEKIKWLKEKSHDKCKNGNSRSN